MSYEPPQLGDFDGDEQTFQNCLGAYEQGWIAFGKDKTPEENPFPDKSDEHWFWLEGFNDNRSDVW